MREFVERMDIFKNLLSDGSQWGMKFTFAVQDKPKSIPDALRIGQDFLAGEPCILILEDNRVSSTAKGEPALRSGFAH